MADYYTHTAFQIDVESDEIAEKVIELYTDLCDYVHQEEDAPTWPDALPQFEQWKDEWFGDTQIEQQGHYLWIYDDAGSPNIDFLCDFLQYIILTFLPDSAFGFSWANTCSKNRIGAFYGGAVLITAKEMEWIDASQWLFEKERAHRTPT